MVLGYRWVHFLYLLVVQCIHLVVCVDKYFIFFLCEVHGHSWCLEQVMFIQSSLVVVSHSYKPARVTGVIVGLKFIPIEVNLTDVEVKLVGNVVISG